MNNLEWLYANDDYLNSFAKLMAQVDGHATDGFTAHEWLMAEHVAVSTTPLNVPSEIRWQYQDGEWTAEVGAPKLQNSQSDAPKLEETDEIGASKCEMRDFDDEHAEGRSTEVGKTSASPRQSDGMDSREKLEADVRKILHSAYMLAWMHGNENRRGCSFEKLHSEFYNLLDRQAAITERECRQREYAEGDVYRKVYTKSHIDEMIRDAKRELELQRERNTELQAALDSAKRAIAKAGGTWTEDDDGAVAVVFAPDVDKLLADLEAARAKNRALKAHIGKMQDGRHGWHVKAKELQERNDVQYVTIERLLERNSELQEEVDSLADERDAWRAKCGELLDIAHEMERVGHACATAGIQEAMF